MIHAPLLLGILRFDDAIKNCIPVHSGVIQKYREHTHGSGENAEAIS
jgi:hypothetical protein